MKRTASCSRSPRDLKISYDDDVSRKSMRKMDEHDLQEMLSSKGSSSNMVYLMEHSYADEYVQGSDVEPEEEIVSYDEEHLDIEDDYEPPDFKSELAKLVKRNDCSNDFTDNLLQLLRKNGHTELPSDKKSLVTKPQPVKLSDNTALAKILENQKIMMKNQMLIMEQMKALARSHETQRIRLAGLTERLDKAFMIEEVKPNPKIFPMTTLDDFDEFNNNLTDESFKRKVFPEITKALQNSSWLFTLLNDDVLFQYNLNGNFNKRALRSTNLYKLIQSNYSDSDFLKERHVQALIKQSHARQNTKNSRYREKLKKMSDENEKIFIKENDSF